MNMNMNKNQMMMGGNGMNMGGMNNPMMMGGNGMNMGMMNPMMMGGNGMNMGMMNPMMMGGNGMNMGMMNPMMMGGNGMNMNMMMMLMNYATVMNMMDNMMKNPQTMMNNPMMNYFVMMNNNPIMLKNFGWNDQQIENFKSNITKMGYIYGKMIAEAKKQGEKTNKPAQEEPQPTENDASEKEITVKFKKGSTITKIKISNNEMVALLLNNYFEKANVTTGTFTYKGNKLSLDDCTSLYELGMKNNDEIIVSQNLNSIYH